MARLGILRGILLFLLKIEIRYLRSMTGRRSAGDKC
jgi:hypothetical protein